MGTQDERGPPPELSHAGSVVDKAIEYMVGQDIPPVAIATALLGGSVALLARSLPPDMVEQVLRNAIEGVRAGLARGRA